MNIHNKKLRHWFDKSEWLEDIFIQRLIIIILPWLLWVLTVTDGGEESHKNIATCGCKCERRQKGHSRNMSYKFWGWKMEGLISKNNNLLLLSSSCSCSCPTFIWLTHNILCLIPKEIIHFLSPTKQLYKKVKFFSTSIHHEKRSHHRW